MIFALIFPFYRREQMPTEHLSYQISSDCFTTKRKKNAWELYYRKIERNRHACVCFFFFGCVCFFSIHRMLIVYVLHLISHFLDSNHFGEIFSLNKSTNDKNYKITVHGTNEYIMLSYTNGERLWTERII